MAICRTPGSSATAHSALPGLFGAVRVTGWAFQSCVTCFAWGLDPSHCTRFRGLHHRPPARQQHSPPAQRPPDRPGVRAPAPSSPGVTGIIGNYSGFYASIPLSISALHRFTATINNSSSCSSPSFRSGRIILSSHSSSTGLWLQLSGAHPVLFWAITAAPPSDRLFLAFAIRLRGPAWQASPAFGLPGSGPV